MTRVRGFWAALVLAPCALASERPALADPIPQAGSEPWVIDPYCHEEGLGAREMRCFSSRWVPETFAVANRARAMARPLAGNAFCDGKKPQGSSPTVPQGSVGASDLVKAYDLAVNGPTGAGKIVALVDSCGYSDLVAELNVYRKQFGIPAITECGGTAGVAPTVGGTQCIGIVSQTGAAQLPPDDSGWAGETALDVQMVSAACPDCSILVVQTNSPTTPDLLAGIAEAVKLRAAAVSNSWGGVESTDTLPAYPGTVIAAASGDADYMNEIPANIFDPDASVTYVPQGPNWPASDPNVLAVGGTTLSLDSASARCFTDVAWSRTVSTTSTSGLAGRTVYGGGSGCSSEYATPAYQSGLAMGSCAMRGSVDVSAAADFTPGAFKATLCTDKTKGCGGIAIYAGGGWDAAVGTSASSPFMAAVLTRMGLAAKAHGFFYTNKASFTDVTVGNNDPSKTCTDVMCNAGVGWDGPTGLGVPEGYELAVLAGATLTKPTPPVCATVPVADGGAPSDGGAGQDATASADGGPLEDTGAPLIGSDSGANGLDSRSSSGCSCSAVGDAGTSPLAPAGLSLAALGAVLALGARRRRR